MTNSQKVTISITILAFFVVVGSTVALISVKSPKVQNQTNNVKTQEYSNQVEKQVNNSTEDENKNDSNDEKDGAGETAVQNNNITEDDSDESLEQDLKYIDSLIGGFDEDSASIEEGLNDEPIEQEQ